MKLILTFTLGLMFFCQSAQAGFQLVCPHDYHLTCGADVSDLTVFGNAYYIEHGVTYACGVPVVEYHLSSCGTGHIARIWSVEDSNWNWHTCTQYIYISGGNFKISDITWPKDHIQLEGCNAPHQPDDLPLEYQRPTWNYLTCSQVASSYNDREFIFGPDCKKILREWTVIDWCTYKAGGSKGIFRWTQTIKIGRNVAPILTCAKEISVRATGCQSAFVSVPGVFVDGAACTGSYKIYNDSPYATEPYGFASGRYPIGKTTVNYRVEYGCGAETTCQTDIIVNPPGPVPYCYSDLNVVLMPIDTDADGVIDNGMVEVWASDLNVGSYHPCNNHPLKFSFSSDITDNVRVFTCAEVGYNSVQMWVTDYRGNQSYCIVNIYVQNNAGNIPNCRPDIGAKYLVSGQILDQQETPLENVIITAKDKKPIYDYITDVVETKDYEIVDSFYNQSGHLIYIENEIITIDTMVVDSVARINVHHLYSDEDGIYGSNEIPLYRDYELSAYKSGDMSRVDQDDLEVLGLYLLNGQEFENVFTYFAADINEDKVLDMEDYFLLEDLVTGEEDEWPLERQWVFYSQENTEGLSGNPLAGEISNTVFISNLSHTPRRGFFTGVLKGDLTVFEGNLKDDEADIVKRKLKETDLLVFPNPFVDRVYFNNFSGDQVRIELFNMQGQKIWEVDSSEKRVEYKTNNSATHGTYFYRVFAEGKLLKTGKLIKSGY